MTSEHKALSGIKVLELGHFYMAPYATLLMAYAGADVVKVEPLEGEHLRFRGSDRGATLPFAFLNSNKRSISLDLKTERGRSILMELARTADVLVENYAPGAMDRLGLGADTLLEHNQRLIYASGSGYGRTGQYRDYAAVDITVQAFAGVMSVTGFPESPPVAAGVGLADFMGGAHLYGAIVTALLERERTGVAQFIEVALLDSVYPSLASSLGLYFGTGQVPPRHGNGHAGGSVAPYNVYPCADGYIAVMCFSETHWRSLIEAMGRPELGEDERFSNGPRRAAHTAEIDGLMEDWTKRYGKTELWALLQSHKVPAAPVRNLDEVARDPNLMERGMLFEIDHPEYGRIVVPQSPIRMAHHPPEPPTPSPRIGQHNRDVYSDWLNLSASEIEQLEGEQVTRKA